MPICCDLAYLPAWMAGETAATWAGALASFLAVGAALALALRGEWMERRRRAEARRAGLLSLSHAIAGLKGIPRIADEPEELRLTLLSVACEGARRALARAAAALSDDTDAVHMMFELDAIVDSLTAAFKSLVGKTLPADRARALGALHRDLLNRHLERLEAWDAQAPTYGPFEGYTRRSHQAAPPKVPPPNTCP